MVINLRSSLSASQSDGTMARALVISRSRPALCGASPPHPHVMIWAKGCLLPAKTWGLPCARTMVWTVDLEKLASEPIQGNREPRKDGREGWGRRWDRDAEMIPGGRKSWWVWHHKGLGRKPGSTLHSVQLWANRQLSLCRSFFHLSNGDTNDSSFRSFLLERI